MIISQELQRRPARAPNFEIEAQALVELSEVLARSPDQILHKLAEVVLRVCGAESACVSIIETKSEGEIFRWRAVAGRLAPFLGGTMPRHFSPCGVAVDSRNHQLMKDLDRHFQYCDNLGVALPEVLLVPFTEAGVPVGTLWSVAHEPGTHFDAENLRFLKSLAVFASAAFKSLKNLERERELHKTEAESKLNSERAAHELATERRKLEVVVDQSPAGIALFRGPEFVFERYNSEWARLVGEREYLGKTYVEAYPELAHTELPAILKNVYVSGDPFTAHEMKVRVVGRSGELEDRYYDFSYIRIPNGDGNPYGLFCHALDVTSRVQTKNEAEESRKLLSLSEERLKTAIEVSRIGFYDWDIAKDEITFSDQMQEDWQIDSGSKLDDALKRIHPDDRGTTTELIQDAIKNRRVYQAEYRVLRPDNTQIWVEVQGRVTYESDGSPIRFVGTSIDITDRHKIRQIVELARTEAEAANLTKSAFLANMSHEIRTPLGVIIGFSEIALQDGQSESEKHNAVERIHRNALHLATLVNDILDLAKVEADKFEPEIVEFATNNFFSDIVENASIQAREKGLRFIFQQIDVLPKSLKTDPTRLKQILMNLIGNAIKFTHDGEVHLSVKAFPGRAPGLLNLQFVLKDSGIGLTPEQGKGLFQAFKQADSSTTRKYGGSGLGLMLSRKIAQTLGGDVRLVSSEPGKGSTFEVLIESAVSQSLNEERRFRYAKSEDTGVLDGLSVLVVEDSLDNQDLVGRYLRFAGARVEFQENGKDGFAAAVAGNFDVILMDVQMPVMGGYEAMEMLRNHGYVKPVIALTAHTMRGEKEKSLAAGFSAHLAKPIDRNAMIEVVRKFGRGS